MSGTGCGINGAAKGHRSIGRGQRGIFTQCHGAGVALRSGTGDGAGIDGGGATDRQGIETGDSIANCVTQYRITGYAKRIAAAGDRAIGCDQTA